jgi:phosphoserine phosphatase
MPDALIFDLDGTVLSVNSFRLWAAQMAWARYPHLGVRRRLCFGLCAAGALAARKSGLISHETLKRRLQSVWQAAIAHDGGLSERALVAQLVRFVRPELAPLLVAVAAGVVDGVLATAAAADYAEGLGRVLGFQHVLATPRRRRPGETRDNVGPAKRDAVLSFLASRGWHGRNLVLFTDHKDDLPLIRVSRTVYWFGPDAERQVLARMAPDASLRPGALSREVLARSLNPSALMEGSC